MKKTILMTLLVLFSFFAFSNDVYAACGAGVTVGEENLCLVAGATGSNTAGTASVENGTLILNNYNGGSITFYSGLDNPFGGNTIKLVGDNYITNENGYGVLSSINGLNFVGDGTLTIKSKLPFVAADFGRQAVQYSYGEIVTIIKITAGEEKAQVTDDEVSEDNGQDVSAEDNTSNDNASESDSSMDLTTILLIVSSVISVLCLIIIVILLLNNKKSKSSE